MGFGSGWVVEIFLLMWVGGGIMDFCSGIGRNWTDGDINLAFFSELLWVCRHGCARYGLGICLSWV